MLLLDLFSLSEELVMKSIVVRSAVSGLRLPLAVLAIVARPALRVFGFVAMVPLLIAGSVLGALLALRRLLFRSAWLVVRSIVASWFRPLIVAFYVVRFSLRVVAWIVRRLVG